MARLCGAAVVECVTMKRSASPPSAVHDVLGRVLRHVDPEQELRVYTVWNFWDDEVGDVIARRAQPARFRDGVLFVTVETHSWMQELRFMKDTLRERLNARLGAELVRDIVFVSGSVAAPPADPEPAPAGPLDSHLISLPPIADPALAEAFARVIHARAQRLALAARKPKSRKGNRSR